MLLMRKVDRSGVLDDIDDPADDLSLITGLPLQHCKVAMERLLKYKVIKISGNRLLIPNFIEAQEASKSNRLRQKESRERRRLDVTKRDQGVTGQSLASRDERSGHSLPCFTDPLPSYTGASAPAPDVDQISTKSAELITLLMESWTWSQEAAEAFLGTQGDVWDTQKDMMICTIGAIIALASLSKIHDRAISKLS